MRVSTMIATKDHFLFIVKGTEPRDELYAAAGPPAGNPIGFLAQGCAATFKKEDEDSPWTNLYSDTPHHVAPILHIRSIHSLFGAASQTDDVVYVSIIPREGALQGEWKKLNNADDNELSLIKNSGSTFQVGKQCNVEIYRDVNTFEIIDSDSALLTINLTFD